jgi:hypothetical protein
MLFAFALIPIYLADLLKNDLVSKKVLWAVILFFFGMVTMPVYWHLFIRPQRDHRPPEPQPG